MNSVIFDTNNIGGLLNITAIPATAIRALRPNINNDAYSLIFDESQAVNFQCLDDGSFHYREEQVATDAGEAFAVEIVGIIPKNSKVNREVLNKLRSREWLVLIEDGNGDKTLCGSARHGCSFRTLIASGSRSAERNETAFTFRVTQKDPSIFIE